MMKVTIAILLLAALVTAQYTDDDFAAETSFVEDASYDTQEFPGMTDDEAIHREAAEHVQSLLEVGKTKDACKSLADSSIKAIDDSVKNAQKIMNAVPKGSACNQEGQQAVDAATKTHNAAAKKAADAKAAASKAKAHPVKFKDVTIAEIKAGDCSAFFSDPAYTAAKTAAAASGNKQAKAEGEAKVAKAALDDAVAAQKKAVYFCACKVQREHAEAKKAADKANSAENEKAWKKSHMMKCVLEGKSMSSCQVPAAPKVSVPALQAPASTTKCGAITNGMSSVYTASTKMGGCGWTYDKIQYLDRQHQSCSGQGLMQGWHMQHGCSNGKDRKTKNYCIKNNKFKMEFGATTRAGGCGLAVGQPLQYLDRLPMYCHADEAMRDFKINYCGGKNMKYTATCVKVTAQGVTTHKSGCHQVQGKDVAWLDRQTVKCPGDTALQGFHLNGGGCSGGKMQYHYKCVSMRKK